MKRKKEGPNVSSESHIVFYMKDSRWCSTNMIMFSDQREVIPFFQETKPWGQLIDRTLAGQ